MIKKKIKLSGKDKFKIGLLIISLFYWIPEEILELGLILGLIQGFATGMIGFLILSVSYDLIERLLKKIKRVKK